MMSILAIFDASLFCLITGLISRSNLDQNRSAGWRTQHSSAPVSHSPHLASKGKIDLLAFNSTFGRAIARVLLMTPKPLFLSKRSQIASFTAGLILFFAFGGWMLELPSLPVSSANALKDHVRFLASDELTGRGIDTPGIKLARDYIAREFAKYGLVPGGDNGSYFQGFDVTTGVAVKQPTALALDHEALLALNEDWTRSRFRIPGKSKRKLSSPVMALPPKITDTTTMRESKSKGR